MIEKDFVTARPQGAPPARTEADAGSAALIAAELAGIVSRSRRPPAWRRGLRRAGVVLTRWLDNLVPAGPASQNPEPPQIRFPFF